MQKSINPTQLNGALTDFDIKIIQLFMDVWHKIILLRLNYTKMMFPKNAS
jgi:hypothetical protein